MFTHFNNNTVTYWCIVDPMLSFLCFNCNCNCGFVCYMFEFVYWACSCIFIHLVVCLMTGPKPLPKWAVHLVWSRASSFKWEYAVLSLRSSSSFLQLPPRLPVTSIPPFIFPSIIRCRRQFLLKMWPIQLAFRLHISCRIFLCS
jgi:hypothetical protein